MGLQYSPVGLEKLVRLGLIPLSCVTLEGIMCFI